MLLTNNKSGEVSATLAVYRVYNVNYSFQEGLEKFSRRQDTSSENHINHWERNLIAAGAVGLIIGLFVASKA